MDIDPTCRGKSIPPPMQMQTSQQLVAIYMLGLGLESMLAPSQFGFALRQVCHCRIHCCSHGEETKDHGCFDTSRLSDW